MNIDEQQIIRLRLIKVYVIIKISFFKCFTLIHILCSRLVKVCTKMHQKRNIVRIFFIIINNSGNAFIVGILL